MDGVRIVEMYWERDERAIEETSRKYGNYCYNIAFHILENPLDAEECVNDTYRGAWDSIPPHRPTILSTYLGKITRRISLKIIRSRNAQKRGKGVVELSLDELSECIPGRTYVEESVDFQDLVASINNFLSLLPTDERRIFVQRYWYAMSIKEICEQFSYSKAKVESMLHRIRIKLRKHLVREGYF